MTETIDYGVCRLAIVPVRMEANHRAEQVTQLLFGDHYEVLEAALPNKWLRIRIYADQYEGWIDAAQHHAISKEYFDQINLANFKITTEITSTILFKKMPLSIVMGSIVPISASELFKLEEHFAFNGESKALSIRRDIDFLKAMAMRYLHAPYLWGGKSPFGIDCSGFTQMIFRLAGYGLMRDAHQQSKQGRPVASLAQARPGDLVFFAQKSMAVSHVGLLLDEGSIIHASGTVKVEKLVPEGILPGEAGEVSHLFHSMRRVLPEA